jgi:hypothetical protein
MKGKASSYGDTKDMAAYQAALIAGLRGGLSQRDAEARARKVGDPGIGWMDNVLSDVSTPWVAVPYEAWFQKWGSKKQAHKRPINVTINGKTVRCILGDTMPHLANITNGAVIDLAPGAQNAFNLNAPFMVPASWEWA